MTLAVTRSNRINWHRVMAVAKIELKQLAQARDFWLPMLVLGSVFFVVTPAVLLTTITSIGGNETVGRLADALDALPRSARSQLLGQSPQARTGYALAVYLLAPMAVIVPLTISTAVGAATIVGERERGTGEFLAHSPTDVRELYLGKLLASIVPGYATVLIGFGLYSLIVNLTVGSAIGHWFFPTAQWWLMILWVLPPFLVLCLSVVVRLSARVTSTTAAQQASGLVSLPVIGLAYSQATGALFGAAVLGATAGLVAWILAVVSLKRAVRSIKRSRLLGISSDL